ncbi:MAG: hypothetical protein AAF226_07295 [Verrucomicrobiota bacterium]
MKVFSLILSLAIVAVSISLGDEESVTEVIPLGDMGLPIEALKLQVDPKSSVGIHGSIDMAEIMQAEGITMVKGDFIRLTSSGLICRLPPEQIELVKVMIKLLQRPERQVEIRKAYVEILLPLAPKDRLDRVLLMKQYPDALINGYIDRIHLYAQALGEVRMPPVDPHWSGEPKEKVPPSPEDLAKVKADLESHREILGRLVDDHLQMMQRQIGMVEKR